MSSEYFVASDIGGTFTDTVVLDASGGVRRYKAATTPENHVEGVLATFDLAAAEAGVTRNEFVTGIRLFSHGTTVATNALLQRRGAKTGVLLTEGFGDTPTIMRGMKGFGLDEASYKNWRGLQKQYSIVDPQAVREIPERVDYAGRVVRPLDEEAARAAVRELLAEGVQAIAVCLLWCTQHPEHERRIVEIVKEEAPELYVSASSDVLPRIGEYARMITTAINAFLGPEVAKVTRSLDATLREAGLSHEPFLMQSNGGLASVRQAAETPVSFLLSGPVGGVVGSRLVAEEIGEANVLTADMGGTSFDVGLVVDGRPLLQATTFMDHQPIAVPSVGVETIGAGGGSIARIEDGALRVGPSSAGAVPGPACYGRGGTEPTVTDADVVLGLVNPLTFLGGRQRLDREAAEHAIRIRVADPLGLSLEDAALGIKRIVDSKMADLCRQATIHKGHDPRNFILVAFGGAGPVHAHAFGAGLGVKKIVVPVTASVHSALGIGASDLVVTHEVSHGFRTPPGSTGASQYIDADEINRVIAEVESIAVERLTDQGLDANAIRRDHFVDTRFRFQIHELTIELPEHPLTAEGLDRLVERFIDTYQLRFGEGSAFTEAGVEFVNSRDVATNRAERASLGRLPEPAGEPEPVRHDRVYFGEWLDAAVYDESGLSPGLSLIGPAIFELSDTNIVVGPGQAAEVDAFGNVVIDASSALRDELPETREVLMAETTVTVDPITYEVISHRLWSINEEGSTTIVHASGSPVVHSQDYNFGIYTPNGDMAVSGVFYTLPMFVMQLLIKDVVEKFGDDVNPGDVFVSSDPFHAGIHQSDVQFVSPCFYGDELVAWTGCMGHVLDIGGMNPGSWCPNAVDLYQEGMIIPLSRIVAKGEVDRALWDTIMANSRLPHLLANDFSAFLSSHRVAHARLREACDQYGAEAVRQTMAAAIERTEERMRQSITELPDGVFQHGGFVDHDGRENRLYKVVCTMTKAGDTITFDYAGTDAAIVGMGNGSASGSFGAIGALMLALFGSDLPWNAGLMRPVQLKFPYNSVVSAEAPMPISAGSVAGSWIASATAMMCLAKLFAFSPNHQHMVCGPPDGGWLLSQFGGIDQFAEPFGNMFMDSQGWGGAGFEFRDGVDTGGSMVVPSCQFMDVETTEARNPVFYLWRREAKDSGGAGRRRGGNGIEFALAV